MIQISKNIYLIFKYDTFNVNLKFKMAKYHQLLILSNSDIIQNLMIVY